MFRLPIQILILGFSLATSITASGSGQPQCSHITLQIYATAENVAFANPPDPTNGTAVLNFFFNSLSSPNGPETNGTTIVEGSFTINGLYCSPLGGLSRGVLQLLSHGSTYNRTVWTGLDYSDIYNYQLFAATEGYHTLAIDRPGHGENLKYQQPDPVRDLQLELNVEVLHGLITAIRSDSSGLGRNFDKVVYVGHSYGALMGNPLARQYPSDLNAIVLTAYGNSPSPPIALVEDATSASDIWPARLGGLLPGYLTLEQEDVRTESFYYGGFDPALAQVDYLGEDIVAVSELLISAPGLEPVTGYTGKVLVVSGAEDSVNYNPSTVTDCNAVLNATRVLFPDASDYEYYSPPNTGHDIMLHYSAPDTFRIIHDWLNKFF